MIRQSLYFTYANRTSEDMGLISVNMSTGMQTEPFAASTSIKEVEIRGSSRRYFQDTQLSPLEFNVSFAFKDVFTSAQLREVASWLTSPIYYSPLVFYDGTNEDFTMVYYALFVDAKDMVTNCLNQGYINLKVRCIDAYAYSGLYSSEVYDYSTNSSGIDHVFSNTGDISIKPTLTIQVVSGSSFTITNYSNSGQYMTFTGLSTGETLTIDCDMEYIESSLDNTYRYDNMTGDYLEMVTGENHLHIVGNVILQWEYEFKYIVG